MKLIEQQIRNNSLLTQLLAIWQRSVRTTHHFLTEEALAAIALQVPSALSMVQHLLTMSDDSGRIVGFMGIENDSLEMLFLDPTIQGQGVGRQMVGTALSEYNVSRVAVNEQNPQARGFYEHLGFVVVTKMEEDDQGNPYPLLVMNYQD